MVNIGKRCKLVVHGMPQTGGKEEHFRWLNEKDGVDKWLRKAE